MLAVAIVFQTLEYLQIFEDLNVGPLKWSLLRQELFKVPKIILNILDLAFSSSNFRGFLVLRLFFAVSLFFIGGFGVSLVLWSTSILLALRFRGAFNGGSDFMSLVVLMGLVIVHIKGDSNFAVAGVFYIAIQSGISYFRAGVVKVTKLSWLNGSALSGFLGNTIFEENLFLSWIAKKQLLLGICSIGFIGVECLTPLVFLNKTFCLLFLAAGALFHLVNFWLFGINRFFWIWISTYPAIFFASEFIIKKNGL
jgi:hypothetical protein